MPNKVGWLTDWLTAWLTKWLDGWLTDCTIASLIILFNPFLKYYVALEIHVVICSRELYGHDVWRTCALLDSSSTLLVRDDIASISSPAVSIDSGSRSSKTPSKSSFIWRPRKKTPSIWKKYLLLKFLPDGLISRRDKTTKSWKRYVISHGEERISKLLMSITFIRTAKRRFKEQ